MLLRPGHFSQPIAAMSGGGGGASYDADATAYFAYSGALADARKLLISNLVAGIKSDLGLASLAAGFDGFWLLANETATAALKNIAKNDHHCTATNSPTFTADQGYAGDGSTSYLNTDYIASTDTVALTLNSAHISLYNRTNRTTNNPVGNAGKSAGSGERLVMYCSYGNITYIGLNCNDINFGAAATAQGFWIGNRSASNAVEAYRNGSSLGTATTASGGLPAIALFIGGTNGSGLANATTDQHAFMSVGRSLSGTEVTALNTRVETYMDAIGAGIQ